MMLGELHVFCPAKLNIHLQVKEKRADNFHSIESIFQTVSLYDTVRLRQVEKAGCEVFVEGMTLDSKNTLTQAYEAFSVYTGIEKGLSVSVQKIIPAGAGLGGGSSNAAALIRSMDKLFETGLREDALLDIAAQVGSDVPFFLKGGAAIVSGRGEKIRAIKPRDDLIFVLIFPEVHSSTKEAYAQVDVEIERGLAEKGPGVESLEKMYYESPESWTFINSFSNIIMSQQSLVKQAFADLQEQKSLYVQMSGAGSSVFGVFLSEDFARDAYKNLSKKWKRSYILTSSTVDCC